ncbi:RRQRL motif-containing zinc-binding protein [Actinopolymorpha pittospori]|uniref:Uncharacterized protein n=1 Tax=Actinopolymorpha pittospori TaxID=648752 RepID=A0A927N7G3_9ACTN|nr:RRQRL motif-containing zinc-binding protein [Actinopolymorpha pittospori]MBE1609865.1 hypothetical protein [Actinopolymorpha pittospori]
MSRLYRWTEYRLVKLWDGRTSLTRPVCGLPAWSFGWAPEGLVTRRQLRAAGLCPGGADAYGVLVWYHDRSWAWLFRLDLAKPKRVPTPTQAGALDKAMATRRWCNACRRDVGYCASRTFGVCGECATLEQVAA